MEKNDMNKNLSDQMKKELCEAKSKEELDALVSTVGMELTDDTLEAVSGGVVKAPVECGNVCYYDPRKQKWPQSEVGAETRVSGCHPHGDASCDDNWDGSRWNSVSIEENAVQEEKKRRNPFDESGNRKEHKYSSKKSGLKNIVTDEEQKKNRRDTSCTHFFSVPNLNQTL